MQNLPNAMVYEKEFIYMPWGILISQIENYILKNAPQNARVLDLVCGPGYLLGKLKQSRRDLSLLGIDLDTDFIQHAKKTYSGISFQTNDVTKWNSKDKFDVIICTAGLHHLPYSQQEGFIKKISNLLSKNGFAIIGDPYIDDFFDETERKLAGAKLGYEYLVATIKNGATDDVLRAAIDVLSNDVFRVEYKSSVRKCFPVFKKYFSSVKKYKTWPKKRTEYGDYYFVLRNM